MIFRPSFTIKESNGLVNIILDNFSQIEILRLFHELEDYVKFEAKDEELLENVASLHSLLADTPKGVILKKLEEIRPDLNFYS